jgi:hypothetical protein
MEGSPTFLLEVRDLTDAQAAVARGHYYKNGVEYVRLFVTEIEWDIRRPNEGHWVLKGYPKTSAYVSLGVG